MEGLRTRQLYYLRASVVRTPTRSQWAEIRVSAGLHSTPEAWEKNPLISSFKVLAKYSSCGFGTEVPISLLAVNVGSLLVSRSLSPLLACGPNISGAVNSLSNPSHAWNFSFPFCCTSLALSSSAFLGSSDSYDSIGSTLTNQDNLVVRPVD